MKNFSFRISKMWYVAVTSHIEDKSWAVHETMCLQGRSGQLVPDLQYLCVWSLKASLLSNQAIQLLSNDALLNTYMYTNYRQRHLWSQETLQTDILQPFGAEGHLYLLYSVTQRQVNDCCSHWVITHKERSKPCQSCCFAGYTEYWILAPNG
jgi:hypothetical protein